MPGRDLTLISRLEDLQGAYIAIATNDPGDTSRFDDLRRECLAMPAVARLLPEFVARYRTREQFWQHIKRALKTYAERRDLIWSGFRSAIEYAEGAQGSPGDAPVAEGLADLDASHIRDLWTKALERRSEDPEGAITAARTLLESVCKLILDEANLVNEDDADLPSLYNQTAKQLQLAPSQHTEKIFKQILGGCYSVVEGLGAIRNRLSDAHGKGKRPVKPAQRHAELVVNLAGAMAVFLAATWTASRKAV